MLQLHNHSESSFSHFQFINYEDRVIHTNRLEGKCHRKVLNWISAAASAGKGKRGGYELWNEDGQVAYVDTDASRGADFGNLSFVNSERGPSRCMGEPIPSGIPYGKFICHRNLNNSGNKRGKKKKCRFQCDKVCTDIYYQAGLEIYRPSDSFFLFRSHFWKKWGFNGQLIDN